MQHLRKEVRKYHVKRRGMEPDTAGRLTQKAIWFDCPFCGTEVKARLWALSGRGKLCTCEALFTENVAVKIVTAAEARNAGINFALRETQDSKPGRVEVEVFAPDSMISHGRTLTEASEIALADARSTELMACGPAEQ